MKYYKLLIFLLFIVTFFNAYIFLHRDDYAYTKQSAYFELYPIIRQPAVHHFETVNDSTLLIKLSQVPRAPFNWFVKRNNNEASVEKRLEPTVILQPGISTYTIFSDSLPDTLTLKAEYYPKTGDNNFGATRNYGIVICKADMASPGFPDNLKQWGAHPPESSAEDEAMLKAIIKDSVKIQPGDNGFAKIRKLQQFFYRTIYKSRGMPSDSLLALPVFQQYEAALLGNKIWCSNYAQIFNMFAGAMGVKSRYIEIKQWYGGVNGSSHVFNEYFLPEKRQWAAIDVMYNNLAYVGVTGQLLNGVQLKNADPADSTVTVLQASGDSVISVRFPQLETDFFDLYDRNKMLFYYYDVDINRVYSFKEKMKRYFTPVSWLEIYSDYTIAGNRAFYIKQLFILFEILLLLLLCGNRVINFFRSRMYKRG